MPLRSGGPAPYAPGDTTQMVITAFRDRGLATPFTVDVLQRAGVTEALASRTLQTLKLLELIGDDGNPTPAFEGLRRAPAPEYKKRLEEIVRAVYAEVFQFADPATDSTDKIADAFRAYDPPGQRGRMVTLFINLCEAAGIIPEGKRPAPATPGRAGATAPRPRRTATLEPVAMAQRPSRYGAAKLGPPGHVTADVPPALQGLLAQIPFDGEGWTKKKRDQFMTTFGAVLDFSVPIVEVDVKGDRIEE
jgi:hypothetical protein